MADETTDLTDDGLDEVALDTVDQDEIDRELDAQLPPPRDRSREAALVGAGLSVVAGVLCIVAPFRAVYTLRAQGISASFDGWGRYDLATGSQHGPRYGIALTVAALVLVIAAATRLRDLRPVAAEEDIEEEGAAAEDDGERDPADPAAADDRLAAGIGIGGSALLLGILASLALSIESTVANSDAIASSGGTRTAVSVGGMLWFLLGAWVVSVLALYVPWFEARRRG